MEKLAKFNVGDQVILTNDNGVRILGFKTIVAVDFNHGHPVYKVTPTDTPWFSVPERQLKLMAAEKTLAAINAATGKGW